MSAVEYSGRPDEAAAGAAAPLGTSGNLVAERVPVAPDGRFAPHHHRVDQLAWPQGGGVRVRVEEVHWRVLPEQFLWIPAHAEHEMRMEGAEAVLSLYVDPALRPAGARWRRPLVLRADELAAGVIRHLCSRERGASRLAAGFALVRDILEQTPESTDALALPRHPAARRVAEALLADPATNRSLQEWAQELGVSSKTLLRGFAADTGATFSRWRLRARAYHAARLLAEGWSVQAAAAEVGYATATGFIKAYRSVYGASPAAHAARLR